MEYIPSHNSIHSDYTEIVQDLLLFDSHKKNLNLLIETIVAVDLPYNLPAQIPDPDPRSPLLDVHSVISNQIIIAFVAFDHLSADLDLLSVSKN